MKFTELWKFWFSWYGISYGGTNHFKLAPDLTFSSSWSMYLNNFFNDLIRIIVSLKKFRKLVTFLSMCRIRGNHWDLLNLKNCLSVFEPRYLLQGHCKLKVSSGKVMGYNPIQKIWNIFIQCVVFTLFYLSTLMYLNVLFLIPW